MTEPQAVLAPLSRSALLLVLTVRPDPDSRATVRGFCADLPGLVRSVGFREPAEQLSCVVGFGAEVWGSLFAAAPPAGLHPFQPISGEYEAPATPGDIALHVRSERSDLCFELGSQILVHLAGAVDPVLEVQGFRFFDNRDLLGFVDGTENPTGAEAPAAALIPAGDFAGGSYLVVQKYLHDLTSWNAMPVQLQQRVIGRDKLSNVELSEDKLPTSAHRLLTTITEQDGTERKIVRDNMPFGSPAAGEFGTAFIGYAADPAVLEKMLQRMFIGDPPGNYDRILDVSEAVSGGLFFVPSVPLLDELAESVPTASVGAGSNCSDGSGT